ncbi:unnamed protein product [Musa acuminata subsp. malaccensis]|uniref:(wild Malaysian banana) hypothetical protein n=1 Tax=Musa acuminata subsp. malaccensis TaxID=214687 RepID=A0A8D7B314_MUSAM|nr:unnamed protein product [Musa acuminata subsp. malaccensis]
MVTDLSWILVRLCCVCGYYLYGAHTDPMMQFVQDALILNVSLMWLVMLWCLCGYYLCGAHTDPKVQFVKDALLSHGCRSSEML